MGRQFWGPVVESSWAVSGHLSGKRRRKHLYLRELRWRCDCCLSGGSEDDASGCPGQCWVPVASEDGVTYDDCPSGWWASAGRFYAGGRTGEPLPNPCDAKSPRTGCFQHRIPSSDAGDPCDLPGSPDGSEVLLSFSGGEVTYERKSFLKAKTDFCVTRFSSEKMLRKRNRFDLSVIANCVLWLFRDFVTKLGLMKAIDTNPRGKKWVPKFFNSFFCRTWSLTRLADIFWKWVR